MKADIYPRADLLLALFACASGSENLARAITSRSHCTCIVDDKVRQPCCTKQ